MYTWIQTYTGKKFDFVNPTVDMVDIKDIARALSRLPRFVAHSQMEITVAEHSLFVCDNAPEHLKLEALLHDAAEAYTGDICSPLKALIKEQFKPIEQRIERVIAERFKLQYPFPQIIKDLDSHALYLEVEYLSGRQKPIEDYHLYFQTPLKVDPKRLMRKTGNKNPTTSEVHHEFIATATTLLLQRQVGL